MDSVVAGSTEAARIASERKLSKFLVPGDESEFPPMEAKVFRQLEVDFKTVNGGPAQAYEDCSADQLAALAARFARMQTSWSSDPTATGRRNSSVSEHRSLWKTVWSPGLSQDQPRSRNCGVAEESSVRLASSSRFPFQGHWTLMTKGFVTCAF